MNRVFFILSFVFVLNLVSCQEKNVESKIYLAQSVQSHCLETYFKGEQTFMEMKEFASEFGYEEGVNRKRVEFFSHFQILDSLSSIPILKIEKLKAKMFRNFGEETTPNAPASIVSSDTQNKKDSKPVLFDFEKVEYSGKSELWSAKNRVEIQALFKDYRGAICKEIIETAGISYDGSTPIFVDFDINEFESKEDFRVQYDQQIIKSKISPDDQEAVRKIYMELTKSTKEWGQLLTQGESWLDDLLILLSLENEILRIRSMAFMLLRLRMGCGADYGFTKILPLVKGPGLAKFGDTVELQVFMGAFNANKQPIVEASGGGKVIKIENGIGYVQVVMPKTKEVDLNGTITLKNKSGIPKTMDWKHKIVNVGEN